MVCKKWESLLPLFSFVICKRFELEMWGWSRIEDNFSEIQYKKEDDLSEDDIHHFN